MELACTTKEVLSIIPASGRSRGGSWGARHPPPPLFLNQTEAKKYFFGDQAPAPLSKGRDDRTSPPLSPSPFLKVWIRHYTCILLFFPLGESHSKNAVSCALHQGHNKMVWFQCT